MRKVARCLQSSCPNFFGCALPVRFFEIKACLPFVGIGKFDFEVAVDGFMQGRYSCEGDESCRDDSRKTGEYKKTRPDLPCS
jgi:hypothetical protein